MVTGISMYVISPPKFPRISMLTIRGFHSQIPFTLYFTSHRLEYTNYGPVPSFHYIGRWVVEGVLVCKIFNSENSSINNLFTN